MIPAFEPRSFPGHVLTALDQVLILMSVLVFGIIYVYRSKRLRRPEHAGRCGGRLSSAGRVPPR